MILAESFARQFANMSARHKELSIISSMDDDSAKPTQRLIDLAIGTLSRIASTQLTIFDGRPSTEPKWFDTWPGEHYRLLTAMIETLKASTIIEIGTFTGMGTLALLQALPADGRLVTFDLLPWNSFEQTWLAAQDFADGRVSQVLANIAEPGGIEPYRALFEAADFIFVDGPKDGITEAKMLDAMATLNLKRNPIVFFDDIRVMNMVDIWRRIARPKFDITSLGHWSGSGMIDWNAN